MSWNCQRMTMISRALPLLLVGNFWEQTVAFAKVSWDFFFFFRICVFGRSTWRLFPPQLHHQVVVSNLFLDFWFPSLILVEYMEKKEANWAPASSAIFGSILVNTVDRSPGLISLPVQSLWNHVCDFLLHPKGWFIQGKKPWSEGTDFDTENKAKVAE